MIYDRASNVIVYDLPDKKPVLFACPEAKNLPNGFVAAKATLPNLQTFVGMGLPVVPLMGYQYDWPRSREIKLPFKAQLLTANFLSLHPRAFVLSDMGTGKTLAALWAADFVMRQYPPGACRCLIVAPLSTLRQVWANAIFNHFLGQRSAIVLHGDAKKREKLLAENHDFYIINHDGLGVGAVASHRRTLVLEGFAKQLAERADIQMVIVDECSGYRDVGTRKHRIARELIAKRPYLWMMSGTPTPNSPVDAYGQAKLINNCFGETLTNYKSRVMTQISQFKLVPKRGAHKDAARLLTPAIRFAISDCMDLPPCTVQRREAELSADQTKATTHLKRHLQLQLSEKKSITVANEGVLRWKLIQIACGAVYDGDHLAHFMDVSPRLKILRECMEATRDKIIIFAPLTSVVDMLYKHLSPDYSCAVVNGGVSYKDRNEVFQNFQTSKTPHVIIAHPETMAHGLTLTAAAMIIWFAPFDRTEIYLQANKRIDRPGQVKATTIVQIAGSAIEREIYRRLEANESMQGCILKLAEHTNG